MNRKKSWVSFFILRPWSAISLCIMFVIGGLWSFSLLEVKLESTNNTTHQMTIEINTLSASTIDNLEKVTQKITKLVKNNYGVKYCVSNTSDSHSTIEVSCTGVTAAQVMEIGNNSVAAVPIPPNIKYPKVSLSSKKGKPIIRFYIRGKNKSQSLLDLTEYMKSILQSKITDIKGVGLVEIDGANKDTFSINFDLKRVGYFAIDVHQIKRAVESQASIQPAMSQETNISKLSVSIPANIFSIKDIENIIVDPHRSIKIKDVATVTLKPKELMNEVFVNGVDRAVSVKVYQTTEGNPLHIVQETQKIMKQWALDQNLEIITEDNTKDLVVVLSQVKKDFILAIILVILIVLFFLGSLRASITPVAAIPISIIATFIPMKIFGCSINVSTLMAFILSVGLVVDDAVVVIENIIRYFNIRGNWLDASIDGTEEIASSIIVMTLTLACVFFPILFASGEFASILKEFAITLSFSVIISGIVSLTLSPMISARTMVYTEWSEKVFHPVENGYRWLLRNVLKAPWFFVCLGVFTVGASLYMVQNTPVESNPPIARTEFDLTTLGIKNKNMDYLKKRSSIITGLLRSPEYSEHVGNFFTYISNNLDWTVQKKPTSRIDILELQNKLLKDMKRYAVDLYCVPREIGGNNFDIFLYGQMDRETIRKIGESFMDILHTTPGVSNAVIIASRSLVYELKIDFEKAAALGLEPKTLQDIVDSVCCSYNVATIKQGGKSYKIVGKIDTHKDNPQLTLNHIWQFPRRDSMLEVNPSLFMRFEQVNKETNICNYMGLPAFRAEINMKPGTKLGSIINDIIKAKNQTVNNNIELAFGGNARRFIEEKNEMQKMFVFAILFIILILLAQFDSFKSMVVIMSTAPLALFGALVVVWKSGSINIYSTIGLLTLVGLITKHGILFINSVDKYVLLYSQKKPKDEENSGDDHQPVDQSKDQSLDPYRHAAIEAAVERLRPVLMTTLAMGFGIFPLMFNKAPAMIFLREMALTIFPGIMIGTTMTLVVVPSIYYCITGYNFIKNK